MYNMFCIKYYKTFSPKLNIVQKNILNKIYKILREKKLIILNCN